MGKSRGNRLALGLLAVSCLLGCTVLIKRADNRARRVPASYDAGYSAADSDESAKVRAQDPAPDDILSLATAPGVETIHDALKAISTRFPDYFSGYTLMHHSESLQDGAYQHPRAIVFGKTARTVITFNDSITAYPETVKTSGQHMRYGYASIEMLSFDLQKGYELREVIFKKDKPRKTRVLDTDEIDAKWTNSRVQVSKTNPETCLECHGFVNPRPIWEHYFSWPGAYGSLGDGAYNEHKIPDFPGSFGIAFVLNSPQPDVERASYLQFEQRRHADSTSRYWFLKPMPKSRGGEKHPNSELTNLFADQIYSSIWRNVLSKTSDEDVHRLVKMLVCDNYSKPISQALERDFYTHLLRQLDRFKAQIGASLDQTRFNGGNDYLPVGLAEYQKGRSLYDPFVARLRRLHAYFPQRSDFDLLAALSITVPPDDGGNFASAMAEIAKIDFSDWAIDASFEPTPDRPAIMEAPTRSTLPMVWLLRQRGTTPPWLEYFSGDGGVSNPIAFCSR